MRPVAVILSLALAVASFSILLQFPDSQQEAAARAAALNDLSAGSASLPYYLHAVQSDSANPYKWSDLARAQAQAGNVAAAHASLNRALALSGNLPQVWLRDANFHFEHNESAEALHSSARVLLTVPDYDAVLFGYFDQLIPNPSQVLAEIGSSPRAVRAYTRHLLEVNNIPAATTAWNFAFPHGLVDNPLASLYVAVLLREKRYDEAQSAWERFTAPSRSAQDSSNLLFNPGFESLPTGSMLDWTIQPSDEFDTTLDLSSAHDGAKALHIRFHGASNVSYKNVFQTIRLVPGQYQLQYWARWSGITTNEGPRLEIADAESGKILLLTNPVSGTQPWTSLDLPFSIPSQTQLVTLRIVRHPSGKFDNKIQGDFWVDSFRLTRHPR